MLSWPEQRRKQLCERPRAEGAGRAKAASRHEQITAAEARAAELGEGVSPKERLAGVQERERFRWHPAILVDPWHPALSFSTGPRARLQTLPSRERS